MRATAASNALSRPAWSDTSTTAARTAHPSAARRSVSPATRAASTSSSVTRAPHSASASAIARPSPLPAPVTIAPSPATLKRSAPFTRVLPRRPTARAGNVHHDLDALLPPQPLDALFDEALEGNGLDPACQRIAAARHLRDDRRKGVHRQRHAGEMHFGHQQVEGRDDDRLVVDRDHHGGAVDPGAVQHRGKGLRHAGRVDRGIGAVAAGEIADRRHRIARVRIDEPSAPRAASAARRTGEGSTTITATPRCRSVRKAPTPIGPAPWMATDLPGAHRAAIHGVPRDRERLDERALECRDARRQPMGVASLHHRVLGEAAGTVVALDRKRRAVVVLAGAAMQAVAAGLHRFDRDQIPELEAPDTLTEG